MSEFDDGKDFRYLRPQRDTDSELVKLMVLFHQIF